MGKKVINAAAAPAAIGPYSHAIDTGVVQVAGLPKVHWSKLK